MWSLDIFLSREGMCSWERRRPRLPPSGLKGRHWRLDIFRVAELRLQTSSDGLQVGRDRRARRRIGGLGETALPICSFDPSRSGKLAFHAHATHLGYETLVLVATINALQALVVG